MAFCLFWILLAILVIIIVLNKTIIAFNSEVFMFL